jgi:hypothetical protein
MHSFHSKTLLLAALLASETFSLPCAPEASSNAIYFLTNDESNAVVAVPIGNDGRLSGGSVTATGGAGSNSIDGATNDPAVPDPLIGQAALAVAGQVSILQACMGQPSNVRAARLCGQRGQQHTVDAGH